MTLILVLLMAGVLSLLESVMLASMQYRQGPVSSALHGVSQLVLDGLKLYSKRGLDTHSFASGFMTAAIPLVCLVGLFPLLLSFSWLPSMVSETDLLLVLSLLLLATVSILVPVLMTSNHYSSLGASRLVKAAVIADILLASGLLMVLTCHLSLSSSATWSVTSSFPSHILLLVPCWMGLLLSSGRAPFDLSEAESELVAGLLTELGGSTFSLSLMADNAELMAYQILWGSQLAVLFMGSLVNLVATNLGFIGSCMLVRINLLEVPRLCFGVLIWPLGSYLNWV